MKGGEESGEDTLARVRLLGEGECRCAVELSVFTTRVRAGFSRAVVYGLLLAGDGKAVVERFPVDWGSARVLRLKTHTNASRVKSGHSSTPPRICPVQYGTGPRRAFGYTTMDLESALVEFFGLRVKASCYSERHYGHMVETVDETKQTSSSVPQPVLRHTPVTFGLGREALAAGLRCGAETYYNTGARIVHRRQYDARRDLSGQTFLDVSDKRKFVVGHPGEESRQCAIGRTAFCSRYFVRGVSDNFVSCTQSVEVGLPLAR